MDTGKKSQGKEDDYQELPLETLLAETPPGQVYQVRECIIDAFLGPEIRTPDLQLHCGSDSCGGNMIFTCEKGPSINNVSNDEISTLWLVYKCKHCEKNKKWYALICGRDKKTSDALVSKVGELPSFGPPLPGRVHAIIGPDRELFLKGRRSENQGLGIAAYTYYRRIVEGQRDRIVDQIGKVLKRAKAPEEVITKVNEAKGKISFAETVSAVRDFLPESLRIDGHNPLSLLHKALSIGVHELTDEECLTRASSVRVVLVEFAERVNTALKEEEKLTSAISQILGDLSNSKPGKDQEEQP